ncbi:MAG: DUF2236 domain-containing protein [Mycobacterium sp.]|nr:DUF2236 domain-containing protein [Mycobacterium sp.]
MALGLLGSLGIPPLNLDLELALDAAQIRKRLGRGLFEMVAGPEGPQNRERIHATPGPRWFADDRPIRRVHADASMFVGGLRALLLQSLHPLAMAGVAEHSDYRADPWGRLQRTSTFLAVTTFGTADDAQRAVDRVRGIHRRVHGVAPDGRPYRADDPHLLEWVHIAEVDSFLLAYQRYGAAPLDQAGRDDYVADTARVATALGVIDPPRTEAQLRARLKAYRSEMHSTAAAREAARFLLLTPPLPLPARAPYGVLSAAAVSMLPGWARLPLRLPYLPVLEATGIRLSGQILVGGIRWALSANPTPRPADVVTAG